MAQPLVVSIPHQIGRDEAKARLERGIGRLKAKFADSIAAVDETWSGDHLEFSVKALGQSVSGALDIADDHVKVEVQLPMLLTLIGQKAKGYIEREGALLLAKK